MYHCINLVLSVIQTQIDHHSGIVWLIFFPEILDGQGYTGFADYRYIANVGLLIRLT